MHKLCPGVRAAVANTRQSYEWCVHWPGALLFLRTLGRWSAMNATQGGSLSILFFFNLFNLVFVCVGEGGSCLPAVPIL